MAYNKLEINKLPVSADQIIRNIVLTDEEIISFARMVDPLPFHINREEASHSIFGRLVASGPHLFIKTHKEYILPKYGNTILAGLGIHEWEFLHPVYPDVSHSLHLKVTSIKPNWNKKHCVVTWFYRFYDDRQTMVQKLYVISLHRI